jgi:hypothetical protein
VPPKAIGAKRNEPGLSARLRVRPGQRKRVLKHCDGVGEINSVFCDIGTILCFVPFVRHNRVYAHMCTIASLVTGAIVARFDALRILGEPTADDSITFPPGYVWAPQRSSLPSRPVRQLTFGDLSTVADVLVLVHDDESIQVTFGAEYIGPIKGGLR